MLSTKVVFGLVLLIGFAKSSPVTNPNSTNELIEEIIALTKQQCAIPEDKRESFAECLRTGTISDDDAPHKFPKCFLDEDTDKCETTDQKLKEFYECGFNSGDLNVEIANSIIATKKRCLSEATIGGNTPEKPQERSYYYPYYYPYYYGYRYYYPYYYG